MDSITGFLNDNPSVAYAALGALKGMSEDKKNNALVGAEIAKTQYSPWLGGSGDISGLVGGNEALDGAISGFMAGVAQKQSSDLNKAVTDAISSGGSKTSTVSTNSRVPSTTVIEKEILSPTSGESYAAFSEPTSVDDVAAEMVDSLSSPFQSQDDVLLQGMRDKHVQDMSDRYNRRQSLADNYWMVR